MNVLGRASSPSSFLVVKTRSIMGEIPDLYLRRNYYERKT